MRYIPFILLFLAGVHEAIAQMPLDSVYWEEKEDTISSLAIKPVKHPKKLLKQVLERLLPDMQREPVLNKYQIKATFAEGLTDSFTVCCFLSAEAGYGLENVKLEKFHYEGLPKLTRQDTISIESLLIGWATLSPVRMHKSYFREKGVKSPRDALRETIEGFNGYDITAYNISSGSGGGVYRISFSPEKKRAVTEITGTAYFDSNTLRMIQFKGETYIPSYHNRLRYQIDYNRKGRTPVVEQIRVVGARDNMVIKVIVRKIAF